MSGRLSYLPMVTLIAALLVLAAGCSEYPSLGERIYYEGRGEQRRLSYSQGPRWLAHGEFGCATCHGQSGEGRSVRAGNVVGSAPPITAAALAARGYDRQLLRRALVEGMTPEGRSLNAYMPRWSMTESELTALAVFLADL